MMTNKRYHMCNEKNKVKVVLDDLLLHKQHSWSSQELAIDVDILDSRQYIVSHLIV